MSKQNPYISKANSDAHDRYIKKLAQNKKKYANATYSATSNAQLRQKADIAAYRAYKNEDLSNEDFEANIN